MNYNLISAIQPRSNFSNNYSWISVITKLLAYDLSLREWLNNCYSNHQILKTCIIGKNEHRTLNKSEHVCNDDCDIYFSILNNILSYEIPMLPNNPICWENLNAKECKRIFSKDNKFIFYNPVTFLIKFLNFFIEYSFNACIQPLCPCLINKFQYYKCDNEKCLYFKNEKYTFSREMCLNIKSNYQFFRVRDAIRHLFKWKTNKQTKCECNCLTKDNIITNKLLIIEIEKMQVYKEFVVPQFIYIKQQLNSTKFYSLVNIVFQEKRTHEYGNIIEFENKCYFLFGLYKKIRLNPSVADFFNYEYTNHEKVSLRIADRFIPVLLVYKLKSTLQTQEDTCVLKQFKTINNQYESFKHHCNLQYSNLKHALEFKYIKKQKLLNGCIPQNITTRVNNLVFQQMRMKLPQFDNYHSNSFNSINNQDKSVICRQNQLLSSDKLKKNKIRTNNNLIPMEYQSFLSACKKLNIKNNCMRQENICYSTLYSSLFGYPIYKFTVVENNIKKRTVMVGKVFLNRSRNFNMIIENNVYIKHKNLCLFDVNINSNVEYTNIWHLKCVTYNNCKCSHRILINWNNATIEYNAGKLFHMPFPHFNSVCRRYIRMQIQQHYEKYPEQTKPFDLAKNELRKIKNMLVNMKIASKNLPFLELPNLESMREGIKNIQKRYNQNFKNIDEIKQYFSKMDNYLFESNGNNMIFGSVHALFRLLHAQTKLGDGTFPTVKYQYQKIGCYQVYIIASWNLDPSKIYCLCKPAIVALLESKDCEHYTWMFNIIHLWYSKIDLQQQYLNVPFRFDYESGVRDLVNSFNTVTENDRFHRAQAIKKNLQKHHLYQFIRKGTKSSKTGKWIYNKNYDEVFKRLNEYILELDMLHTSLIEIVWFAIAGTIIKWAYTKKDNNILDESLKFITYVTKEWIECKIVIKHNPAIFFSQWVIRDLWNCTNNALEGLNRFLNQLYNKNCSIKELITIWIREEIIWQQDWSNAMINNQLHSMRRRCSSLITKYKLLTEFKQELEFIGDKQAKQVQLQNKYSIFISKQDKQNINNILHKMCNISRTFRNNSYKLIDDQVDIKNLNHDKFTYVKLFSERNEIIDIQVCDNDDIDKEDMMFDIVHDYTDDYTDYTTEYKKNENMDLYNQLKQKLYM